MTEKQHAAHAAHDKAEAKAADKAAAADKATADKAVEAAAAEAEKAEKKKAKADDSTVVVGLEMIDRTVSGLDQASQIIYKHTREELAAMPATADVEAANTVEELAAGVLVALDVGVDKSGNAGLKMRWRLLRPKLTGAAVAKIVQA